MRMKRLPNGLGRFWNDRRGNFAVLTALTFIPVLMSVGAAVDMGLFYRGRNTVQSALDAAALAAAKQFPFEADDKKLEEYARDFFEANTSSLVRMTADMTYEGTEWTSDKSRELKISSCFEYEPIFLAMLKVNFTGLAGQKCAEAESVIVVGNTTVEVAMVLDTSGSMDQTPAKGGAKKIVTLRAQATKAVNTLFGSGVKTGDEDPVKIAIVPFSGGVNVGAQYLNEWWMDPKGLSKIHHENFDWSTYKDPKTGETVINDPKGSGGKVLSKNTSTFVTRQYVYQKLTSYYSRYTFGGCVEARPAPYGLTDDAPSATKPDTFFVPYFAPDESDEMKKGWTNSYLTDSASGSQDKRQMDVNKYFFNTSRSNSISTNNSFSPNYICDSSPLTPLTINKATALQAVKDLDASGSTNVDQGVSWGWRVLSKGEPFTTGRPAGDEKNTKAMIVMTDGENTYYQDDRNINKNETAFGSYGFAATNRIFDYKTTSKKDKNNSNYTQAIDDRTAIVCENAKNDGRVKLTTPRGIQLSDEKGPVTRDGIIIYTIAFDIPAASKARVDALLKGCASYKLGDLKNTAKPYAKKEKYFYSADSDTELQAAFSDIMASLSSLRIAR